MAQEKIRVARGEMSRLDILTATHKIAEKAARLVGERCMQRIEQLLREGRVDTSVSGSFRGMVANARGDAEHAAYTEAFELFVKDE